MKKSSKRVIAIMLTLVMTLSVFSIGAVSLSHLSKANNVKTTATGSNIVNANSVDEAIKIIESTPDFHTGEQTKANAPAPVGAPATTQDSVVYPTIIIPGISQSVSYLSDANGNPVVNSKGEELSGGLLILDSTKIAPTLINHLFAPLTRALINQNDKDKKVLEGVRNTVSELFSIQASNNKGKPINNLKTIEYKCSIANMTEEDRDHFYRMIPMKHLTNDVVNKVDNSVVKKAVLDEDNIYFYSFPLIGDPIESAKNLDKYIQFVKQEKGVDKVNIITVSLGGTILTAYMDLMKGTGYPDLNRIINVVSCLQGTDIMGDFYLRKFNLEDNFFFREYLPMIMKENEGYATLGYILNIVLKIMPRDVVYSILTGAVDGIIDTLMLKCPQFWSMIPTDRYEDAKAKYHFLWEDSKKYGVLTQKLDKFQEAKLNLNDNLLEFASSNDRLVHNICGYGLDYSSQDYCFFAAMASSNTTNSDAIIDIDSSSLGATYAKAGEVLSDDILFSDSAKVSPEGSIDISTCLFPQNVWFFHGQHHEVGRNDAILTLVGQLITGEIKSVNDDSANFPQFNGNRNTRKITRWYSADAEAALQEYADGTLQADCTPEDIEELKVAYTEALNIMKDTVCEPTAADAATIRLEDALRRVGKKAPKKDDKVDKALEAVAKFLDDVVSGIFGPGNGFSEIEDEGFLSKR